MKSKVEQRKKGTEPPFFRNTAQGQPTSKEPIMIEEMETRPRQQPMKCWGCNENHMFRDFPQRREKLRTTHNVQQAVIVEDMGRSVPRIYVSLDTKQAEFWLHMIDVEGKINDQPIAILIDSGASHSYLDLKMVERFQLTRSKLGKPWFVQLATWEKMKINEMVKACPMEMNGMRTKVDLNIIPLGSYDFLIGMDWLDQHHVVLDYYNNTFTCLDEQGNLRIVQGIPRAVSIREILALQLKKIYRKGCQVFVVHMEEAPMDRVPSVEDCAILNEFEDVFK
jgi:hypothetical protein